MTVDHTRFAVAEITVKQCIIDILHTNAFITQFRAIYVAKNKLCLT